MGKSRSASWIGGTVVVALLMLVATWFLGVSPKNAEVAEADEQRAQVESSNEMLEAEIVALKKQFANIDQYKAELAALDLQVPTTAERDQLTRQISAAAEAAGVVVSALSLDDAQELEYKAPAPAVTEAPEGEASGDASAEPTAEPTDPAAGEGQAAGAEEASTEKVQLPKGTFAFPVAVTVVGKYADVMTFAASLQSMQRVVLVSNVAAVSQKERQETEGIPALERGDLEVAFGGYAYVLPRTTSLPETTPEDAEAPLAPLPVPGGGANGFAPAVGS